MNNLLAENNALRMNVGWLLLFCFAFPSPFSIGTTSLLALPVGGGLIETLLNSELTRFIISYIPAFLLMIFFPKCIIWTVRLAIITALLAMLVTLLPWGVNVMTVAYGLQHLCDIFIIALEICIIVNLFSKEAAVKFMCMFYAISCGIIVLLEGKIVSVEVIRVFAVVALLYWLYFLWRMPAKVWPTYVHKADNIVPPRMFFTGIYLLVALGSIFVLFGHIAIANVPGGFISYLSAVFVGIVLYALWKRINLFKIGSVLVSLGTFGVAGLMVSTYIPVLAIPSCVLICASMTTCGLNILYGGVVLAERYPSRFIAPVLMTISLAATVASSLLFNTLRYNTQFLYTVYLQIAITLAILYFVISPYLIYALREKGTDAEDNVIDDAQLDATINILSEHAVDKLSRQEIRLAELIMRGYSNPEIVKILAISDNTVRSYRKSLYSKLQIHSRRELFELMERG